jgi:hypothetical protein
MTSAAYVSECGKYRYVLSRVWHDELPPLLFIMLNPSTADAHADDPTIRRCVGFARRNDFGGIHVVNLFAYRATDPRVLSTLGRDFVVGPDNDRIIDVFVRETLQKHGAVVAAWGAHARSRPSRVAEVLEIVERHDAVVHCLRQLSDGTPAHPLMLPYSCTVKPLRGTPT